MDPLTHALCGASLAALAARSGSIRTAALIGGLAGLSPDLDVLIRSAEDPLLTLQYHRHFTHALVFVPVMALLCSGIGWLLFRHRCSFLKIYLFCFLGILPAGLLDACTSYGTQLYWPFSDERVAWSTISIVDPLFTGVLLLFLILALWRRSVAWVLPGIVLGLMYIGFGAVQRDRAEAAGYALAAMRGDEVIRLSAKPTLFNNVLFRVIYETEEYYQTDGIRVGWFGGVTIYHGEVADRFDPSRLINGDGGSVLEQDIARFAHFSQDWLAIDETRENVIIDFRYSLFPDRKEPLWGIIIDPDAPDQRVRFQTFRLMQKGDTARLWKMIRGIPLVQDPLSGAPGSMTSPH